MNDQAEARIEKHEKPELFLQSRTDWRKKEKIVEKNGLVELLQSTSTSTVDEGKGIRRVKPFSRQKS